MGRRRAVRRGPGRRRDPPRGGGRRHLAHGVAAGLDRPERPRRDPTPLGRRGPVRGGPRAREGGGALRLRRPGRHGGGAAAVRGCRAVFRGVRGGEARWPHRVHRSRREGRHPVPLPACRLDRELPRRPRVRLRGRMGARPRRLRRPHRRDGDPGALRLGAAVLGRARDRAHDARRAGERIDRDGAR